MKFRNIYKKIDIFAKPVPLNIGGHEHFKTGTGATLTLLYLAAILAITVQQFIAYFDRENPTTSIQGYSTESYPRIDLFKEKLIPFFIGSATDTDYLPVEQINKYVTLRSHRLSWVTNELGDGVIDVSKLTKPFTVVPCKSLVGEERELFSYVKEDSTFYDIFINFGMCPKISGSLTIEGKGVDDFMEEFIFNVKPCTNPNKDLCATKDQMDLFTFIFVFPSSSFNASNFKEPHTQVSNANNMFYLSTKVKQYLTLSYTKNEVYNYVGLNPEWKKMKTYFDIEDPIVNMQNRDETRFFCTVEQAYGPEGSKCTSYFSLDLMSSGRVVLRRRQYQTLTDTVGTIGGVTGIISTAFFIVYGFINEKKRTSFIMKNVYSMHVASRLSKRQPGQENRSLCSKLLPCLRKGSNKQVTTTIETEDGSKNYSFGREQEMTKAEAKRRITDSLDVLNIVRDSCYMRIIVDTLLRERHKGLAQLMDYKLWKKQKAAKDDEFSSQYGMSAEDLEDEDDDGEEAIHIDNLKKSSTKLAKYNRILKNQARWLNSVKNKGRRRHSIIEDGLHSEAKTQTNPVERLLDDVFYKELIAPNIGDPAINNVTSAPEEVTPKAGFKTQVSHPFDKNPELELGRGMDAPLGPNKSHRDHQDIWKDNELGNIKVPSQDRPLTTNEQTLVMANAKENLSPDDGSELAQINLPGDSYRR